MHQEYLEKEKKTNSINKCTTSIHLGNTCRQFLWGEKIDFLIVFYY